MSYVQTNQVITLPITSPVTINASDTGKLILVPGQAGAQIINLPIMAPGLCYKFIKTGVAAAGSSVITPTAAVMQGQINSSATFSTVPAGSASITFAAAGSGGDILDVISDGTVWFVKGCSKTAAGMSVP